MGNFLLNDLVGLNVLKYIYQQFDKPFSRVRYV